MEPNEKKWRPIDIAFVAICVSVIAFSITSQFWMPKGSTRQMIAKAKPAKPPAK